MPSTISPCISLHLPVSPRFDCGLFMTGTRGAPYLPISPHISPYLPMISMSLHAGHP